MEKLVIELLKVYYYLHYLFILIISVIIIIITEAILTLSPNAV
jgi:hypothetical protein